MSTDTRLGRVRTELRSLLILATPIIIAQLAHTAMGFVDTLMAGRVSPQDLAAVALGNSIWVPVFLLMTGILLATTPKVAQRFGAGQHAEIGPLVRQALEAGALGYLTKTSSPQVLIEAVKRTLAGHVYIEQDLATHLACNRGQDGSRDPRLQGLTQRELEIFVMLAKGIPNRRIAEQLCISSKTVSNNLTLLKSKLQVSSQAELVHLAIDTGVLRLGLESA